MENGPAVTSANSLSILICYSIAYDVILDNKMRGSWVGGLPLLYLGISQLVVSNCGVHHFFWCVFFYYYYYYYYCFPFLFFPIKLFLSQPTSFTFFLILSPIPLWGSDQTLWCLAVLPVKPQYVNRLSKTTYAPPKQKGSQGELFVLSAISLHVAFKQIVHMQFKTNYILFCLFLRQYLGKKRRGGNDV